jgi:hypothetical protein
MFKSIGKAFSKMFSRKPQKVTMDQAVKLAKDESTAIEQHSKKEKKSSVSKWSYTKKDLISKKSKRLAIGFTSNAMARNVRTLELSKRSAPAFGNFRAIKSTWYLPRKVSV